MTIIITQGWKAGSKTFNNMIVTFLFGTIWFCFPTGMIRRWSALWVLSFSHELISIKSPFIHKRHQILHLFIIQSLVPHDEAYLAFMIKIKYLRAVKTEWISQAWIMDIQQNCTEELITVLCQPEEMVCNVHLSLNVIKKIDVHFTVHNVHTVAGF
jgi:hypothetical protein